VPVQTLKGADSSSRITAWAAVKTDAVTEQRCRRMNDDLVNEARVETLLGDSRTEEHYALPLRIRESGSASHEARLSGECPCDSASLWPMP